MDVWPVTPTYNWIKGVYWDDWLQNLFAAVGMRHSTRFSSNGQRFYALTVSFFLTFLVALTMRRLDLMRPPFRDAQNVCPKSQIITTKSSKFWAGFLNNFFSTGWWVDWCKGSETAWSNQSMSTKKKFVAIAIWYSHVFIVSYSLPARVAFVSSLLNL